MHVQIAWQIYHHQQKVKVSPSHVLPAGRCLRALLVLARGAGLGGSPEGGGCPGGPQAGVWEELTLFWSHQHHLRRPRDLSCRRLVSTRGVCLGEAGGPPGHNPDNTGRRQPLALWGHAAG